ncbi:TPA: LysR family transcriptional regulator, partial [Klebsiella quasipneumoniae subsp. similipneumoniae]|nr:LysR family transcriptional regulator [Klebsiella quasipneumoniae subsp. similipneumoniae]
ESQVDSQLALIMRQQEPVSSLAEKCFAEAQGIFG